MPDPNSPALMRFKDRVEGNVGDDVHLQPAPPGSLLMLGYISLHVPDADLARRFYTGGLDFRRSPKEEDGREVRVNGGLSQFSLPVRSDLAAQRWPGYIRLWVKDCRETMQAVRRFGSTRREMLLKEISQPAAGGQFRITVRDVFDANEFQIEDAPATRMAAWMALSADPFCNQGMQSECSVCLGELSNSGDVRSLPCNHTFHTVCIKEWLRTSLVCPICKVPVDDEDASESNVLAVINATYKLPVRGTAEALMRFYESIFQAAAELLPTETFGLRQCIVHFSPGPGLHQTLIFEEDPFALQCSAPGIVCLYARTVNHFLIAFQRCKEHGVLSSVSDADAKRLGQFETLGCVDPVSKQMILPLRHVIRSPKHPECPVRS